jgi:predicted amidohydrolase
VASIKIGLVQSAVSEDMDSNLTKTARMIKAAAKKGVKIICLQELFATRYFAETEEKRFFSLAEKIPGKTSLFLSKMAREHEIVLVGGSLFEEDNGKYYNTSLIFDASGKIIAKYRKVHIPHDPHFLEQFYFLPGDLGFVQAKIKRGAGDVTIAPLICYDQWFPEAARVNALKGAQIIFYPTAIGWFKELREEEPWSAKRWEDAMRSHASLNGIFVAAANRVGRENGMTFWGGSFVADPFGEVVARASSRKDEVLVAEINIDRIKESQEGWGFFRNRRPKEYSDMGR